MKYRTCPNCGCNIDHGERCTCQDDRRATQDEGAAGEYADMPTTKAQQPEPAIMPGA